MKHFLVIFLTAVAILSCKNNQSQSGTSDFAGTWRLLSRTDRSPEGKIVPETTLGSDPIAILFYDPKGNMAVQIMKRNRDSIIQNPIINTESTLTNTGSFAGYDAYFGRYEINFKNKTITHIIEGSIIPSDIGKKVKRNFEFKDNKLYLSFESTNNLSGKVTRTLIWKKIN